MGQRYRIAQLSVVRACVYVNKSVKCWMYFFNHQMMYKIKE